MSESSTTNTTRIFYELDEFPKLKILQEHWEEIRDEMRSLGVVELDIDRPQSAWGNGARRFLEQMSGVSGWIYSWQAAAGNERPTRNTTWLNFPLMFEDTPVGKNAECCPVTLGLLTQLKGIHAAGFSLMKPDAFIYPHKDTTGAEWGNLAFHLGLDVPLHGESILTIGAAEAREADGKVIIFDATHLHSAVSKQPANRTILYIDFEMSTNK
jgi:beta-hydroxylase